MRIKIKDINWVEDSEGDLAKFISDTPQKLFEISYVADPKHDNAKTPWCLATLFWGIGWFTSLEAAKWAAQRLAEQLVSDLIEPVRDEVVALAGETR